MNDNPYVSPETSAKAVRPGGGGVVPVRVVLFVLALAAGGALIGLAIGAALGVFVPDYYRSVFPSGDSPHFNPVAVGIGQGLGQGTVVGLLVGVFLVAIHHWYHLRATGRTTSESE